jgi:hypothetical protein
MKNLLKHSASIITALALIVGLVYGIYWLIRLIWESFSLINSTVAAGIIAATATIIVSVISVLVFKRLDRNAELLKEHREKTKPIYEDMVQFIFRLAFSEKLGQAPLTEAEIAAIMATLTEKMVVWGSDDVINAWFKFRNHSINTNNVPLGILFDIEDIMLAIRRDLGHPNKNVKKGKILGLFINDIHENIKV